MKKSAKFRHGLHLALLAGILFLLYFSYSRPWAIGSLAMIEKTVYVSDVKYFGLVFIAAAALGLVAFLYVLITRKSFWPGFIILASGGLMLLLCWYVLGRIKAKEISLFGIDPLTILSTRPGAGLTAFFICAVLMGFIGLIYLFESLFRRK